MGKLIWSKEKCHEEALKYKTKIEFKKNNGSAYNSASKNKWLDEICSHMHRKYKVPNYWTKERCHEEALKYNSRNGFKNGCGVAYSKSIKMNWIDDVCSHMKQKQQLTKKDCHVIAMLHKTKTEFARGDVKIYRYALKNKWLDEICSHMIISGNRYNKCIYSYEFIDNSVYIGLTYNLNMRDMKHKNDKRSSVYKRIQKINYTPIIKKLTNYVNVEDAIKLEEVFLNEYKNNGWEILNKNKTGSIGGNVIIWNKEACKKEAKKYSSRSSFARNSGSAYYMSLKKGWLDEICSHMKQLNKPNGYWTKEKCFEVALKYKKLEDIKNNDSAAYRAIYRHGWNVEIKNMLKLNI